MRRSVIGPLVVWCSVFVGAYSAHVATEASREVEALRSLWAQAVMSSQSDVHATESVCVDMLLLTRLWRPRQIDESWARDELVKMIRARTKKLGE